MDEVKEAMRVDPKTATTPQDFLDKSDMKWNANFADEAIEYDISTGNKPTDIRYQVSDSVYQAMAPEAIENIITTSGESLFLNYLQVNLLKYKNSILNYLMKFFVLLKIPM